MENFAPRPYQQDLFEKAKESNTICVLPTGSGKTLVSCLLISYVKGLKENENKKTLFLVPTRPLVVQQRDYIEAYFKDTNQDYTVGSYGSNAEDVVTLDENVSEVSGLDWKSRDVYVSTPQVVLSAMQHSDLRIENIDLIVFDECHHARKDHPYRLIVSDFYKPCDAKARPRMLGLTASVVLTLRAFAPEMRELELNLDCKIKSTELPINNDGAQVMISEYRNNSSVLDEKAPVHLKCANDIGEWCQDLLGLLALNGKINPADASDKPMQIWNLFAEKRETGNSNGGNNEKGEGDDSIENGADNGNEDNDYPPSPLLLPPPIPEDLGCLTNKARLLIKTLEEWDHVDASQFKGIIFCKERIKAVCLSLLLSIASKTNPKLGYLRVSPFMSHSSMSKTVQNNILDRFRRGEINTIVSTSVLEEGLDVPECNVVIRYDLDETIKSMIQSKGRARAEESVFILLCPDDDPKKDNYIQELNSFYSMVSNTEGVETESVRLRQAHQEVLASLVYEVPKTHAKVNIKGAKALLSQFLNARLGNCKKDSFQYNEVEKSLEIPADAEAVIYSVSLTPEECSKPVSWKKLLDLKLVAVLHENGDLDDNLKPVKNVKESLLDELIGPHPHSYGTLKTAPFCVPAALRAPWKRVVSPEDRGGSGNGGDLYYSHMYEVFKVPDSDKPKWEHSCTLFREKPDCHMPYGRVAKRMCLLTPEKLDDVIERLEFFGNEGKKKSMLLVRYMGMGPQLTPDQIQLGDKFNCGALGEWKKPGLVFDSFRVSSKHYFVLPFCLSEDRKDEVDWERASEFVTFNETYDKAYIDNLQKDGPKRFINNPSAIVDLKAGLPRDILLYTPYSNPRAVFGPRYVSKKLTPASPMRSVCVYDPEDDDGSIKGEKCVCDDYEEGEESESMDRLEKSSRGWNDRKYPLRTYAEYYAQEYKIGIRDMSQKLIYSPRGDMVPELCRVYPLRREENAILRDLKKRMWRVEFALSCAEFKNDPKYRDEFSRLNLEEFSRAFTSTAASTTANYENLEFFGDTAVKFCVVTNLFLSNPKAREKFLVKRKNILVSNKVLSARAQEAGLDALIVPGCAGSIVSWVPPSMINYEKRTLGLKMVADVFEALTGLSSLAPFDLEGSDDKDFFLTKWDKARDHLWRFGLKEVGTFNQVRRDIEGIISTQYTSEDLVTLMTKANVTADELYAAEKKLRYKFKNKALLCEAFVHESCCVGRGYQRLEFLGDAVLDAIVTQYFFRFCPEMSPYVYSELRRSVVQNSSLAWVVVANKLHPFLHFRNEVVKRLLERYIISLKERGFNDPAHPPLSPWEDLGSPKTFGDLFESITGAIYLDARGDMTIVNEVILPFLMPLIRLIKDPMTPDISPMSRMAQKLQVMDFKNKIVAEKKACKNGMVRISMSLKDEDNPDEFVFNVYGESTTKQMAQFNVARKLLEWFDENEDFINKHKLK